MLARFFNPVRCVCGPGALDTLPELIGGRSCALVIFPEARALGLLGRLERILAASRCHLVEDVQANPDVAELAGQYDAFQEVASPTDVVVAVGGGSVIDTAKVLMVRTASGRFADLHALVSGGAAPPPAGFRELIAVPTTAGTGSEVTPWATVWDRGRGLKHSLHLAQTWPTAAVVDPELTLSLPWPLTRQTGLDALSHALESIWNVRANPVSDTLAVAACREILDVLPRLGQAPSDLELRGRMSLAALHAGLAFSNTQTALAHSISYALTLHYGVPHGIACSFSLPMVLEMALGRDAGRDRVLAQALGTLDEAPRRLAGFLRALGVGTRFSDHGVGDADARRIVAEALGGARGRNFIGKPSDAIA
jgi:phosphonate metabolism-associated iron-containing alcohol dehydrogenase